MTALSSASLFLLAEDPAPYRKLSGDGVAKASFEGESILKVEPESLRLLSEQAFSVINHLLRLGTSNSCGAPR